MTERLFSVDDACLQMAIHRTKFYALLKEGRISAKKIGNKTVVPASVIEAFIASLPEHQSRPHAA
jgi:excisionase family DNA binding protein